MSYPSNLRYTKDHEWVLLEGNIATVGITNYAQDSLGDITFCDINSLGKSIAQHEIFGYVETPKAVSELYMPVTGVVKEVNAALETQPDLVNSDPYDAGWMIKVEVANAADVDALLSADDYAALVG